LICAFDSAWRARALAGDTAAVTALADAALGPLFRFCLYRVGRDRHLCEEVVQETLVWAIRNLRDYNPLRSSGNIFSWLTGIARNQIHKALSRQWGTASLEGLWDAIDQQLLAVYARLDSDPFDDDLLSRQETAEMVNMTMSQLPEHYRQALEAKYVQGRSVREIAAVGEISEKAVESMLTRARAAFRGTFLALARSAGTQSTV
jgi:RNA polymerase sigma-70 factor, ECF subfamily